MSYWVLIFSFLLNSEEPTFGIVDTYQTHEECFNMREVLLNKMGRDLSPKGKVIMPNGINFYCQSVKYPSQEV